MCSPVTLSAPLLPAGSPRIVGIVNITADAFSDGGRYLDPTAALAHARRLRADGADVIELSPAASHPGSAPVSAAEERRRRLAPVLEQLAVDGITVSVDSFLPETLRFAVWAGGPATLAAEVFAASQGTDYIRTHHVAATRDALTLLAAISSEAGHA
jgi:dihydropteroate synthase